jgi:hypothetical protein
LRICRPEDTSGSISFLCRFLEQFAPDQHAADFTGAGADLVEFCVAQQPPGRLLRDAKLYEIGAGTSEIRRMLIGRELFAETE